MTTPDVLISEVGPRDGLQSRQGHDAHGRQAALDRRAATRPACARSRSPPSCRRGCCRRWPTPPRWCAMRVTLPGLTVMALVPNRARRRGRARGRRAQAHHAGVGERRAFAGQRAQDARGDGRGGARHRRRCAASIAPQVQARGRHLHRLRLHAAGRGAGRRGDPARRAVRRGRRRRSRACPTPSAMPTRRRCAACSGACAPSSATRPAPPTCTTRAASAWPTASRPTRRACAPSTRRSAASAAAPMRRARRATSSPKTWSSCSRPWASRTGIDIDKLIAARAPLIAGLPGEPVYGMTPEAGLPKGFIQGSRTCLNTTPPALRRHPRRRVHPHGDGPDLRHAAGRPRRRGHQGRADRGRQHAPPARLRRRLLPDLQPQQEEHRARPQEARGRRGRAAPDRHRRHRERELQARHDEEAGPGLRQPRRR